MLHTLARVIRKHASNSGSRLIALLATWMDFCRYALRLRGIKSPPLASGYALDYLAKIEIDGICIVENFWSKEECKLAREEVDCVIEMYPNYVNGNAKADQRVYGANNASELLAKFANDPVLTSIASAYNREPTIAAFTLAARMPYTEGNNGSGEGWHRDALLRQFKAILYLSDVGPENGPFQFVKYSFQPVQVLRDIWKGGLRYMQYRLSESEVDRITMSSPERLSTYTANAGTLILVDTSSIHRGMPIQKGMRYALTNYYFPVQNIDGDLLEKFKVLTPQVVQ
jgi:hypothetical protein